MPIRAVTVLVAILALSGSTDALIAHLKFKNDKRTFVRLEDFGFSSGGVYNLSVTGVVPSAAKSSSQRLSADLTATVPAKAGFIIGISTSTATTLVTKKNACELFTGTGTWPFGREHGYILPLNVSKDGKTATALSKEIKVVSGTEGYYTSYFVNCCPKETEKDHQAWSFEMRLVQFNVAGGKSGSVVRRYLSVGEQPLISLSAVFCAVYLGVSVFWVVVLLRARKAGSLRKIHHLMTALLVIRFLSLMFESVQLSYQNGHGSRGGWAVPYFGLLAIRGTFLFVLIALLGSGWSFVKPFLNRRDKFILAAVFPLQVVDNIALVFVEGQAPGADDWASWDEVFRIFDIFCWLAVMLPILWSIQHLREASKTDGKAAANLRKLQTYREFYLLVFVYVYFRIVLLYLLSMSLSFKLAWMSSLADEIVTIVLYFIIGWKFRPVKSNPYLEVAQTPEDDSEVVAMQDIGPQPTSAAAARDVEAPAS